MNRAYQEELARVRIAALLETLGNLCGLAIERGDSAARERIGALIDALQQYQDSEQKEGGAK